MTRPISPMELGHFRLERLPSRNQSFRATRLTTREHRALLAAREGGDRAVQRAFWAVWRQRRKHYRLFVCTAASERLVACTKAKLGRPKQPVYLVEAWVELKSEPGCFVPRVNIEDTVALVDCEDDQGAFACFATLPILRDSAGQRLSRALYRIERGSHRERVHVA